MKKILVVVLTHKDYFHLFPRVWETVKQIKIPVGYQADFVTVVDSENVNHPEFTTFNQYIKDNQIDLHVMEIDMSKEKKFKQMDYVHSETRFTQVQVFRVSETRNMYVQYAIQNNYDYLLNVDGDVLIPADSLTRLLATDKDIIGGWTYNKKTGGILFSPNRIEYGDPYVVRMIGTYCLLEKRKIFTTVPYRLYETQLNTTDDYRRNIDVRKYGFQLWVHPYVYCQHLKVNGEIYEPGKEYETDGKWY